MIWYAAIESKVELADEIVGRAVDSRVLPRSARAELDEMRPVRDRGVVLEFVVVLVGVVQRE